MPKVTIYHNPRCSKSRETLQLLRDKNIELEVVEYLENPPSAKELSVILSLLGFAPRGLMRTNEPEYKELGLGNPELDDETLIAAMAEHPKLIERPIVVANGKAAVGRPPEKVLAVI